MPGKRRAEGDSLYKVYLDRVDTARLEMLADRLFLDAEHIIVDALHDYFDGLNLAKISQRKGARANAAETIRHVRKPKD